ncbi:MAG TPA: OmpP1/FadL family transporter [Methyloceanibacter sp.]|nr:OmpP1/FadL family transporter [Methyloceanibacter sp.]
MQGAIAAPRFAAIAVLVAGLAIIGARAADAGGFGVREQSASGLGAAFAGIAAGSSLSSIFWNPAAVSLAQELEAEIDGALILPDTHISGAASLEPEPPLPPPFPTSIPLSFLDSNGGDFAGPTFVPAFYAGAPLRGGWSVGFGFNGPFGVTTEPDNDNWAGKFEGRTSRLKTYNFNPVASYAVTPALTLGVGAQIEFADVTLKSAYPGIGGLAGRNPNAVIDGDDYGFGYTLGALWRPTDATSVGLGFRSSIEHSLDGKASVAGVKSLGNAKVSAELELPEIATLSLRQKTGQRLTLLGTVEWTNWSDLDRVVVKARTTNPALGAVSGAPLTELLFQWHDGWFFSGGGEFALNDRATLRAGVAWEQSPIRHATERLTRVADSDRVWLSVGASYSLGPGTSLDVAYAHVFFDDGAIDRATEIPGAGSIHLLAEAEQELDIVAVSLRMKLGAVRR